MDMATRRARVQEASEVLATVITKYQDVLGPQSCTVHGGDIDECDDDCNIEPDQALIRSWILVQGWELADGEHQGFSVPDYFTPPGTMSWEIVGLLTHALDDVRGIGAGVP